MWKKILGGFIALIVIVVGLVFWATSGMTEVADNFFKEVKAKQYDKAYAMLSEDFKRATSEKQMIAFLEGSGLTEYKSSSWGNRSFEGEKGKLEGSITTESGGAVPLTINFVKAADGTWQIYSIAKPEAGTRIEKSNSTTQKADQKSELTTKSTTNNKKPNNSAASDEQQYLSMVKNTIHQFAVSINQKNMAELRDHTAKLFRDQVGLDKFNQAFASFMQMGIDFTALDPMEPHLSSQPRIDENGGLHLEGYYETTPKRFHFALVYVQEEGKWKLVDINVNIK